MLATIPALDTLHAAPVETRQFVAQALLDFAAATAETAARFGDDLFPFRPTNDNRERSARNVLGLDMETGADAERRSWLTSPDDLHPGIRALHAAVNSGTFTPVAPTPTLTASGDEKARARQADALAVMRRREAMALADREAADTRIRDLEARLAAAEARPAQVERVGIEFVAWGPSHPDWMPFWRQAAADAEAAGNCSEYDRHAEEMGGPLRASLRYDGTGIDNGRSKTSRYDVTVYATVTLVVSVECTEDDLRENVESAVDGYSFGDAEFDRVTDYSVDSEETSSEHGAGAYWNNPESE